MDKSGKVKEKRFTLRMDESLFRRISAVAKTNRRSVAKEIECAIAAYLQIGRQTKASPPPTAHRGQLKGGYVMTEYERSCLKSVNAVLARQLPEEISNMLIGKGLTLPSFSLRPR